MGAAEVIAHTFLTLILDGGKRLTSHPRERNTVPIEQDNRWIQQPVWMDLKRKFLALLDIKISSNTNCTRHPMSPFLLPDLE
jgi:hypothetical protein